MIDKLHHHPVHLIKFNPVYEIVVSADKIGMLEYWTGSRHDYTFPRNVSFDSKLDTDLFEFAKEKTTVLAVEFSLNGKLMATLSKDRKIRMFDFLSGKITQTIDESLEVYSNIQQSTPQLANMEFGRRIAIEKDIERNEANQYSNLVFDESGLFLIYGSLLGVKSKHS